MLNYNALIRPSPNDANLRTTGDPLGMLREGNFDSNRYYFSKGLKHISINNRTSDPFNHTLSTGGYNSDGATIHPNHKITAVSKGGIVPFPPEKQQQYIGNEYSNNPVPLINAFVAAPIDPIVSKLVDEPLPPTINPIAVR